MLAIRHLPFLDVFRKLKLPRFSLRLDVLRNRKAISVRFKNEALNIRSAIAVSYYFCFRTRCCLRSVLSGYYNIATHERLSSSIFGRLWDSCGDFGYAWMFCGSVQRFRYAVRMKHLTFRSAMAVSHYFCF